MADKDFVVKNGLVVNTNLIYATSGKVGIANASPDAVLTVTGTANIQGNFATTGTLRASGAANLSSTLGVSGAANLLSTAGISGAATLSNTISVTGNATFANSIIITGNANFSNTLSATGATNLSNTLSVSGAATLSSTLSVTGAANVLSTFGVGGAANLFSTVGISGAATLSSTASITGATTIANTIAVTGNATFSNTLAVTGASTLANTLAVTGQVTVGGTTTINGSNVNVTNVNATNLTGLLQTVSQTLIVANNSLNLDGQRGSYYSGLSTSAYTNAVAYAASNTTVYSTFAQNTAVYATFSQNTAVYATFITNTAAYAQFANSGYAASNTYVNGTFATNTYVNSLLTGSYATLAGAAFTGPISAVTGSGNYGVRIAANATNTSAILQFTNNAQNAQWAAITATNGYLDFSGTGRFTGDVIANYSDDRLKNRGTNIPAALDKVKALSGFFYTPNQIALDLGVEQDQGSRVGVSAQEVQAVLPEAVKTAPIDEKYLTVQYEKLVPLLIEAIKELEEKVRKLSGE